mmetsp:Transcript_21756/g.55664  ORF Transcript_21756/g.55664 Transcript_21756/m.55664 type:complete len:221 (-) Transcript_21756:6-668(-)
MGRGDRSSARAPGGGAPPGEAAQRLMGARRYKELLVQSYERCRSRAKDKLGKLRRWAMRQHDWALGYVEDALWKADAHDRALEGNREARGPLLAPEPPGHVNLQDLDQRLAYSAVVALVNSRAREFVPYFTELLQAPLVRVRGFVQVGRRLEKVRRLAAAIVQLKGPACGGIDLSSFDWINELRGEEEVFSTLRYLVPEMEDLVREFAELEQSGDLPLWR